MTDISNFGRNRAFRPHEIVAPASEAELLDLLRRFRGRRIRAVGRLHSWSEAPVAEDVLVDLRRLDSVTVHADGSQPFAEVGAGCQIKRLLTELLRQGGFTTPSLGLITEQAIAGALSTGTHGSGRNSLSHYPISLRVAQYDPATGEPVLRTIDSGDDLRAARCALGGLGIVTSVRLPLRTQYQIEEHFRRYDRLDDVLQREAEYDLQQFFFIPWVWKFVAQHRREIDAPRSLLAPLYRLYWSLGMDVSLHLIVLALARFSPRGVARFFIRHVLSRLVPLGWKVIDRSDRQLTMEHELFRHIEIEVFVTRSKLGAALTWVEWLLRHCGGDASPVDAEVRRTLEARGQWPLVERAGGNYFHHYPICVRKVLPDDTLLSMTAGDAEPRYAVSFISYASPRNRAGFDRFAEALAASAATLFDARPHWGKVCPLPPDEFRRLYPRLDEFATIRRRHDPEGRFLNAWLGRVLGDGAAETHDAL